MNDSVFDRLSRDGKNADALSFLLGYAVNTKKTESITCPEPSHHEHGDSNESGIVCPDAGGVKCAAIGRFYGLAELAVLRGLAATAADAAKLLEDRFYPVAANGNGAHKAIGAADWPWFPKTVAFLGWETCESRDGRPGVRLPTWHADGSQGQTKRRYRKGDGKGQPAAEFEKTGDRTPGLINLPALLAAPKKTVAIVCGETDLLAWTFSCRRDGIELPAISHSTGESGSFEAFLAAFKDATVYFFPDNDAPGRSLGEKRREELLRAAATVHVASVPAPHKDVCDFIRAGGGVRDLVRLAEEATAACAAIETSDAEELHHTDLGNAGRLVARHGKDIRYVPAWKSWLIWDDAKSTWRRDEDGHLHRLAHETIRAMHKDAVDLEDRDARARAVRHALASESRRAIEAMVAVAATLSGVAISHTQLDADPWKFATGSGVVDLRTGEVAPTKREDLLTRRTPVLFDPDAKCPRWSKFIDEILLADAERKEFIQRFLGSCLTGSTRDQAFTVFHGGGSNGKTTLIERIRHVMGDYAVHADASTFFARRDDGQPRNDLARLVGARLVSCAESGEGRRLDEGLIKSVTGGEPLTCRRLYEEPFEFTPQFKILLATNHRPAIWGTDHGIWRRMRLIPFDHQIPAEEQDRDIGRKLDGEAAGILSWLVRGCLTWQECGPGASAAIDAAMADYRVEQDLLAPFLADRCRLDPAASISASALYKDYREWCDKEGEKPVSATLFGRRLSDHGPQKSKSGSSRVWKGIELTASLFA